MKPAPDPYAAAWSPRLNWITWGRKPCQARLPGLEVAVVGRTGNRRVWRCCLNGVYSN